MDESNLPNLHIRHTKKNRLQKKDYGLPDLSIQRKRKLSHKETTMSTSMEVKCFMCGEVNVVEIDSFGNFVDRKCDKCGSLFFDDEGNDEEEDYYEEPPDFASSPPSPPSTPAYQRQDRYQPEGGKSRLGKLLVKDSQTGEYIETRNYVDIPQASRREGLYIIGITGTGKTGLIENLIIQDIKQGRGIGLLDPHGDLTQAVLSRLPPEREKDVIYLDISDEDYPFGLNLFTRSNPNSAKAVQVVVEKVMHIFEKLFDLSPATTPRLRQYLRNCTQTLIVNPSYTMADMPFLLLDEHCRKKLIANVTNIQVQGFWKTFNRMKPSEQLDHADSTLNKLDELLQPLTVNIVGQSTSTINLQRIMNEGKILLVKLSAELDSITNLIGSVLIAMFLNAGYSRTDLPVNKRRQFNLYADEFQRFATEDFAILLTEARKFGIATTIAHQARYQPGMTDGIRATSLSAKNLVVFQVNNLDGDELAGKFDITPPPATIDVRRPQQHRRIEEQVEVEVEEDIMEISQNPVEYLKSARGTHGNARVREAAHTFLSHFATREYPSEYGGELNRLLVDLMERRVETGTVPLAERIELLLYQFFYYIRTLPKSDRCGYDIKSWLKKENNYLSEDYFWAKTRQRTLRVSSDEVNEQDVERLLCKDNFDKLFYDKINPERWGYPFLVSEKLHRLAELHEAMQQSVTVLLREMVIKSSSLSKAEKQLHAILSDYFLELACLSHFNTMEKKIREIHNEEIYVNPHKDMETWNELGKYYLTKDWEQIEKKWKPKLRSEKIMQLISDYKEAWHLTEEAALAHVPVAVNDVVSFVRTLLVLCEGLAQDPIMVPTGQKRMVKRIQPHITYLSDESERVITQRSYPEMLKVVSSELANLDNFMARVKYINADQKTVECTIRTLDPKQVADKALFGQALEKRIGRIKYQNFKNGYVRERAAVEAEIRQRQEQCCEPPEEEPPISRRPQR